MREVLGGKTKNSNGCLLKMHQFSNLSTSKHQLMIDRVTSHQLIILENPPKTLIEEIKVKPANETENP